MQTHIRLLPFQKGAVWSGPSPFAILTIILWNSQLMPKLKIFIILETQGQCSFTICHLSYYMYIETLFKMVFCRDWTGSYGWNGLELLIEIQKNISVGEYCLFCFFIANSADPDEVLHSTDLIWVCIRMLMVGNWKTPWTKFKLKTVGKKVFKILQYILQTLSQWYASAKK